MNVNEVIIGALITGALALIGWFLSSIMSKLDDVSKVVQSLAESRAASGVLSEKMAESLAHIEEQIEETMELHQALERRVTVIETKTKER